MGTLKNYTTVQKESSQQELNDQRATHNLCNNGDPGCTINASGKLKNANTAFEVDGVTKTMPQHPNASIESQKITARGLNGRNKSYSLASCDGGWRDSSPKSS